MGARKEEKVKLIVLKKNYRTVLENLTLGEIYNTICVFNDNSNVCW